MTHEELTRIARLSKRCLHLGDDTSVVERSIGALHSLDIGDLTEYFDNHESHLAPLLFWHLKRKGLGFLLKSRLSEELQRRYYSNLSRNFLLKQSLESILAHFCREGVEAILLKGAASFAADLALFQDAFVLFDLDLLVRPSQIGRAAEILISDGFRLIQEQTNARGIKRAFLGPDHFTRVDLHSDLFWKRHERSLGYHDYVTSDLWRGSILVSVGGYPARILSVEDQICYRLVHDGVAHHELLLLKSTTRLYYLCVLIHFYRGKIDWIQLLHNLREKGSERLLVAYILYGHRELGLPIPPQLREFQNGTADLALLESVVHASKRLADYSNWFCLAVLASRTVGERVRRVLELLVRDSVLLPLRQRQSRQCAASKALASLKLAFKRFCLQVLAILYVGEQLLLRPPREGERDE